VGASWDVTLDPAASWIRDDTGLFVPLDLKDGVITIIDPTAPMILEAGGDNVEPGQLAMLSIETAEPVALSEAILGLRYDPALADDVPVVDVRSKVTGVRFWTDVSQPGLVRVRVVPDDPSRWNLVPGPLADISFHVPLTAPWGLVSPVTIDPVITKLRSASGVRIPLQLEPGDIEIR
jgi:hypothetical protein